MEQYSKTTQETVKSINSIRIELRDEVLSSTDFTKLFKSKKVSYAAHLTAFLIKRNVLVRFSFGEYGFADSHKPIHIKMIDEFVKQSRELQKSYTEKYLKKEKEIELITKDGFKIKGTEHTDLRVVTVSGQFVIIDQDNKIVKMF